MSLHICRDFLTDSTSGIYTSFFLTSLFMHKVMNWSVVGATGFDISGSFMAASGSSGSLNLGSGREYEFQFPSGSGYTVSWQDERKILVLRSEANSRLNSGIFRVTAALTSSNTLRIDYRSTQYPPQEIESLTWGLYVNESSASVMLGNADNGSTSSYASSGSAGASRVVFQSPYSASWQVRLCCESFRDYFTNGTVPPMTVAPGFEGNSRGDFPVGGQHLHGIMWRNTNDDRYIGTAVGFSGGNTTIIRRYYMWGNQDSSTPGSFILYCRNSTADNWCGFGFCEDEVQPLPPFTIQRMFVLGQNDAFNSAISRASWNSVDEGYWGDTVSSSDTQNSMNLVGFGYLNRPILGALSCYVSYATSAVAGASFEIWRTASATDSPWSKATDLMPAEVVVGQMPCAVINADAVLPFETRRLGLFPVARIGRANFGNYTVSSDTTWIHMTQGIYLPWSGSTIP